MAEVDQRNGAGRRAQDSELATLVEEQRKRLRNAAIGYLILLVSTVGGLFILERNDARRARDIEAKACERVNLLREQSNATSEVVFATLWTSAQRERSLARGPRAKTHQRSATVLAFLANRALQTGLTDCHAVANDPHYQRPRPQAYNPRTDPLVRILRSKFAAP